MDSHSKLTAAGHTHAVKWWQDLHTAGHPIPQAMRCFDKAMSEAFASLWNGTFPLATNNLDDTVQRDWHLAASVLGTRKIFNDFSKYLVKSGKNRDVYQRFSAACRLYAQLLTWQGSWLNEPLPPDVSSEV
jgi:hypothetical protein